MIKRVLKQILASFDYEVRKRSHHFVDDFTDQTKLLHQQDVKYIFDLGANIGQTAAKYRRLFPSATIYSFEPTDEAFKTLCETFKDCDFVKPQKLAVTNATGHKQFFSYKDSVTNSLLPVAARADRYMFPSSMETVQCAEVQTITIDEFCRKENIEQINILKMDIQGGEILALQGAVGLLSKQAIDLVYAEVLFSQLYENQANFHEVNKLLEDYGYSLYGIYNFNRCSNGKLGFADAIFISNGIQETLPTEYIN